MNETSAIVRSMIEEVRRRGDAALCGFARKFDRVSLRPEDLVVREPTLKSAWSRVSPDFQKALKECSKNIEAFARAEKKRLTRSWLEKRGSVTLGQRIGPVERVGLYIPGGRFPYPSTVLMSAIPARVAGVESIAMASPPKNLTAEVMAAAYLAGVRTVYRVGGAGAIAALAYGTRRIKPVDLIVGPGNPYVTEAKRQIFGDAGIDALAGPSEVVIIADKQTPPAYIEADLLAQAEHDPAARALLLTTDRAAARQIRARLDSATLRRVSVRFVSSLRQAIEEANRIAPEHLELLFKNAERVLPLVKHAGAIFLGPETPAALGDYAAGPSHVLPTRRSARFSSGLSVATFMKRSSVIGFQGRASERPRWQAALTMAQAEGMAHHEASLRRRLAR